MQIGNLKLGADKTPCKCGHARDDHREVGVDGLGSHTLVVRGECEVDGCDCSRYTAEEPEGDKPPQ